MTAWDTWDRTLTLTASRTFWVIGYPGCRSVSKSSYLFIFYFIIFFFHQYYSLLKQFSSLTTTASWCFPSKGKNSLKHTSNPPELTFSNHKYIASFGFVLRVYLTETNTRGLEAKLCKKMLHIDEKLLTEKLTSFSRDESTWSYTYQWSCQSQLNGIKDLSKAKGSKLIKSTVCSHGLNFLPLFHLFLRKAEKVVECILYGPLLK